jgi:DNA-binding beta-propeller fold protein YncE
MKELKMKHTAKVLFMTAMAVVVLVAGCATPQQQQKEAAVFYPPAPDLPRVQFLTSFSGAVDIEGAKSAFESFVTGEKEDARKLGKPYGVAIYDGKIYVCDTNATVMVFDLNKRTYEPLQGAKGLGKLIQPINISIDKDGTKYVSDPIRNQVVVFDKNDFYVRAIGRPGEWKPVDAVPYGDELYVADIDNSEVKVFNKATGAVIRSFGRSGKPEELLDRPVNLTFDRRGYLYVTDMGRFQVIKFDRDGHFLGTIGDIGTNVGHFQRPRGVAADGDGRIFVVDAAYANVQVFTEDGQNLLYFGKGGAKPGDLTLPAQVVIDHDNLKYFEKYVDPNFSPEYLVLVTSQFGKRLVNVFAFGKEKGVQYPTDAELLQQLKERLLKKAREEQAEKAAAKKEKEQAAKPAAGDKDKGQAVKPDAGAKDKEKPATGDQVPK